MIQVFVDRFMASRARLEAAFAAAHPGDYRTIVKHVVNVIGAEDEYDDNNPDPERIHEINDGNYQGTLVYVIGARGYQPSTYYYVKVSYGSCSSCDTLESIRNYDDNPPTPEQIADYMSLALHIVQGLKQMGSDEP